MTKIKEVKVDVLGPEPSCVRCQSAKKVADKVAEKVRQAGILVKVEKVNIISKDVVKKYGVLVSPAVAINDVVKIIGRGPGEQELEKLILEAAE